MKERARSRASIFRLLALSVEGMETAYFSFLALGGGIIAGFLGALTGLGGGFVLIPLLVLGLDVDLHHAMGVGLLSSIATSSAASAAFLKEGFTNLRIATFLGTATAIGALCGALLCPLVPIAHLTLFFGLVLLYSCLPQPHLPPPKAPPPSHPLLQLEGNYPKGNIHYTAYSPLATYAVMIGAGLFSGLLGIGSGALKVFALEHLMRLPFKVATMTSNVMIGVTAAASAGIYLHWNYIVPSLAFPAVLGVLLGALVGSRLFPKLKIPLLRFLFTLFVALMGLEMVQSGISQL